MSVRCGNCHQRHDTVGEVRECYGVPEEVRVIQEAHAKRERARSVPDPDAGREYEEAKERSKARHPSNRRKIRWAKGSPLKVEGTPTHGRERNPSEPVELEDEYYFHDGRYYKVLTSQRTGQQYGSVFLEDKKEWEYLGKKPLYFLRPEEVLNTEQAKRFGMLYGRCVYGHKLSREESLYVGYGKTCARNHGLWYPTKAEMREIKAREEAS